MKPFHILLLRQVRPEASDDVLQREQEFLDERAQETLDFYRWYARHVWDVQIKAMLWPSRSAVVPPHFAKQEILDWLGLQDLDGFDPTHYHILSMYKKDGYCGEAVLMGNWGVTYEGCPAHATCHELGHNLGLHHANVGDQEYADTTDIMGEEQSLPGFGPVNLHKLGLESPRETIVVEESRWILLAPIELKEHSLHANVWQTVIARADDDHYVALRKRRGVPYKPRDGDEDTLYIYTRSKGRSVLMDELLPSESFVADGLRIDYDEYHDEIGRVCITLDTPPTNQPEPIPMNLPPANGTITEAHTGIWYEPHFNGSGFGVQVRNGRMTVMWYTYDDDGGQAYYTASADISNGPAEFDVYTTSGGTFTNPASHEVTKAGWGNLYFTGDDTGVFTYNLDEYGRGSYDLVRLF